MIGSCVNAEDRAAGAGHLGLMAFQLLMRDPRWDGLPFILETPMISGSLKIEASPSKSSKGKASSGKGTVKAEDISVDITATDSQPNEHASTSVAPAEETPLTLGGSTWRREIELLHELEKVPVGQTSAKIDMLHAEIMAIVLDTRKKDEAAKEAKKAARAALKAAKKGNAADDDENELPSEEGEEGSMPDNDDEEEEKPKPKRQKKAGAAKSKKGGKKEKAGCAGHDEMSD